MRRQQLLLERSALLRGRMAQDLASLQRPLALVDTARDRLHWLAAHPQWLALPAVLVVALRPRRILGLAMKVWSGWRFLRNVQRWLPRG